MDVVAFLSEPLLTTLRVVLRTDSRHRIRTPPPMPGLVDAMRDAGADVLVLEPSAVPAAQWPELLDYLRGSDLPTVVVYTTLAPPAMLGTVELARLGVRHIVLKGYDDTPRHFRALFDLLAAELWRSPLHDRIAPLLSAVPGRVRDAVAYLFRAPHRVRDVEDLASLAAVTPRTLHRWLRRSGIASTKRLIAAARVEWGIAQLRSGSQSVELVSAHLHYPTVRRFRREAHLLTGTPPAVLRWNNDADSLTQSLLLRLQTDVPEPDDEEELAAVTAGPGVAHGANGMA